MSRSTPLLSPSIMSAPSAGVWQADTVRDIAESLGIQNLSDEVATALAADVEYRLHEMIEESIRFMRHGKRTKLKVEDVDHALKARNVQPLWGFTSPNPLLYRKVTTNNATLYFVDDEEVDLDKNLQTQLPPVPREVSYTAHWLAIEGVQPAIPENPTPAEIQALLSSYNDQASRAALTADSKPLTKRQLSRELQLYFQRLTTAATDSDETMRNAALGSLRADSGLSDLVPYLVQWIADRVQSRLSDLNMLDHMLDLLNAIVDNESLYVEPYLHSMLPPILSILLASTIGQVQSSAHDQFSTRHHAASLLSLLFNRYSNTYPTFKPRVLQLFIRGLVDGKSFGTMFGAIAGIRKMGHEAIKQTLTGDGNIKALGETIDSMANSGINDIQKMERNKCIEEAMTALGELFGSIPPAIFPNSSFADLESRFGSTFARQMSSRGTQGQSIINGLISIAQEPASSDAISLSVIQDAIIAGAAGGTGSGFPFSATSNGDMNGERNDDDVEEEDADADADDDMMEEVAV